MLLTKLCWLSVSDIDFNERTYKLEHLLHFDRLVVFDELSGKIRDFTSYIVDTTAISTYDIVLMTR